MNHLKKVYTAVLLLFVAHFTLAQAPLTEAYSSPKGVYIRLADATLSNRNVGQTKFVVKRRKLNEETYKTIGQMQLIKTYADFQVLVGVEEAKDFGQMKALNSPAEVMNYFNSKPAYQDLALFAELKIEFLQAIGFAFLDNTAQKQELYQYQIYETAEGNKETMLDEVGVFYNPRNFLLNQIKTNLSKIRGTDSSVNFRWEVDFPTQTGDSVAYSQFVEQFNKIVTPEKETKKMDNKLYEQHKALQLQYQQQLSIVPVDEFTARFNVYYRKNNESRWKLLGKKLVSTDSTGKKILLAAVDGKLDDLVETMIVTEDNLYNTGDTSKIARGVIAHNGTIELIYGVKAEEAENSIILKWKKLSNKPYYSGIEIAKSWDNNNSVVIQILPVTADTFTDTDVFPAGRMFTYFVRPIFIEFQALEQDIAASTAMTCGKFNRPTPPFNLTVKNEGISARLNWEVADEKAAHSFFVFRGTSPQNMIPIRSAVKENTYLDTTGYLSARLTYYYAIMATNVTEDTSALSPYAQYVPQKNEEVPIQSPTLISSQIVNDEAVLTWADVKLNDDFIRGYVLQRKTKTDKQYVTIYKDANATYTDTTFRRGIEYLYRVASFTVKGDTMAFADGVDITAAEEKSQLQGIENISLTNLSKSIRVEWPSIEVGGTAQYKVYRKLPTETNFKLLATLPNGTFEYEDTTIKNNITYVYTITALNNKKEESDMIEEKSVVREIPR